MTRIKSFTLQSIDLIKKSHLTKFKICFVVLSSLDWLVKLYRVRISDLQIMICGSTLSFCEVPKLKLSLCQNFCLQENPQASVYTSSLTICLYLTPKTVEQYTFFFHLDRNLVPNAQWGDLTAQRSPYSLAIKNTHLIFEDYF